MKKLTAISVLAVLFVITGSAWGDPVDLTSSSYNYDISAGTADIITISYDYSYGNQTLPFGHAAFRIRRLNNDGTDSWLGSFNIYANSFNLDTDYGPYSKGSMSLAGTNTYEWTLNRSNGLWDLAINGTTITDFVALASTTNPQANGDSVTTGEVVANKFFSDESEQSGLNAIALGWATLDPDGTSLSGNAADGVGGTGAYRLQFEDAPQGFVDNIQVTAVPVPAAALLGMFGFGVAGLRLRKGSLS